MKKSDFTFLLLVFVLLHVHVFADIAPMPIKAKTIYPGHQTSVRMESEKVIIDLYNDSSVVRCSFNMKNLGEHEKLRIGFPEMDFYHYRLISESERLRRFKVKENGKAIKFWLSDSLRNNEEFRKKVDSNQLMEDWYLWEGEFEKGESKTIDVQYSLPFGMLYKSNKRFFTYLVSTGANWMGTIGKAEIIVNLKDIEMDSIVSCQPEHCDIINKQIIWTFSDLEPTTNHDIKIFYNSSQILYKGKKTAPPVFIVDDKQDEKLDQKSIDPNTIASIQVLRNPEETRKYTNQKYGVIKIYTKDFVLTELKRLIKAKSKEKIALPGYDQLKANYRLFIDEHEVDFAKVIGMKNQSVAKLEIISTKDEKTKIKIELKK